MQAFSCKRKDVLQHLQSQGMTRKQAKAIQNRCVFGGRIESLQKKYDIPQCVLATGGRRASAARRENLLCRG